MRQLFILLLFVSCAARANADWQIKTGNNIYPTISANWNFANAQLQRVQTRNDVLPLRKLHLSIKNGKTEKQISLSAPQIKMDKSTFTATQLQDNLRIVQNIHILPAQLNALQWEIEITNSGSQEAWLEAGLAGSVEISPGTRFWDGYEAHDITNAKLERSTPAMGFPATMLWGAGRDAIVVSMDPDNSISWIKNSLDPTSKMYFYGGRFVIPAKQKVLFGYTLFALHPHFGELDAIDGYFQRFPFAAKATPNTDPRLTGFRGVNASYVARNVMAVRENPDPRTVEGLGRLYANWDWGYNPYKFSGDWYGREENWNLPLSQGDQTALETFEKEQSSFDLQDITKFHQDRIKLFKRSDIHGNISQAFYIVNFVQSELAQKYGWEKYFYGYRTHDDLPSGRIKRWVASYDDTWHMFPWATPSEDIFRRDLPAILKELDTSSFAIDLYGDTSPYRGPTTKYLPGWSYDEKGKFIATDVAHKELVKFIHTQKNGDFTASAVVNVSPFEKDPALKTEDRHKAILNYSTTFAPDAYILEGDVSDYVDYDQPDRLFPKRYLFGQKYISSVGGAYHDQIGERIPWRTMSPNQIREAIAKYYKKRVMAYYQGGFLPNYDDQRGIELIANETPRLLEIQSRGFTATPASTGNAQLQRRRYGTGVGAAIVYSNPTAKTISDTEILQNEYFGNDAVLVPFDADGRQTSFSQNQAEHTVFPLDISSMENRIMLFPLSLQVSHNGNLHGTSRATLNSHQQEYEINLTTDRAQKVLLPIAPPRDFALQSVNLNGKDVTVIPAKVETQSAISLDFSKGKNAIKVLFTSKDFFSDETAYGNFDWKNYSIDILGTPNDKTTSAAQIIADYSLYYWKFTPEITHKSTFAANADKPLVVISVNPAQRGVRLDAARKVLFVTGKDAFDAQQLAWRLMRLIDRTENQIPNASFTNLSTKAMLDAVGLMYDAQKSSVAKIITMDALKPVAGEDKPLSGAGGDVASLDFSKILPLPRDGWKVSASAIYTNDKTATLEAAIDGKPGTRWTGGKGKKGAWFMIDMQKPQDFNHVQLQTAYPWEYYPRQFKAEVSDDGTNWRNPVIGDEADATKTLKTTEIFWPQMQKARYVRITLTEDQNAFWSIDEVYVYKRALQKTPTQASTTTPLASLPKLEIPKLSGTVHLDGDLDETVWKSAAEFELSNPLKESHPITQKTQIRVFHDDTALYLGFVAREANMDKIWEPATTRDGSVWDGDDIEIYLAPGTNEGQIKFPYYQFLFTPSGIQADLKFDATGQGDLKWDGKWEVKTKKSADHWTAEVRIPFTDFEGAAENTFRVNIGRLETPNGDTQTWAPMKRIFANPDLFGVWELPTK